MPRKWINVGTNDHGQPIKRNVYGKTDEELDLKIAQTLVDYGLIQSRSIKPKTPFSSYAQSWFNEHQGTLRDSSADTYGQGLRKYILPFFKNMYLEDITFHDVKKWLLTMRHLARETVNLYLRILRMIFDTALEDDIIGKNPAKSKYVKVVNDKAQKREAIPTNKLERILKAALMLEADKKKYLYLLAYTGMRKGEALALKWGDIDFKNNIIHIRHSAKLNKTAKIGKTKTDSSVRDIPLPQTLKNILEPMKKGPDFLIIGDKLKPMSNRTYEKWMMRIREEIPEMQGYSAHHFRHTFLTMLSTSGKPITTIQNQAGHASSTTTIKVYVHKDQESINSVADAADMWMNINTPVPENMQAISA